MGTIPSSVSGTVAYLALEMPLASSKESDGTRRNGPTLMRSLIIVLLTLGLGISLYYNFDQAIQLDEFRNFTTDVLAICGPPNDTQRENLVSKK